MWKNLGNSKLNFPRNYVIYENPFGPCSEIVYLFIRYTALVIE